MTSICDGFFLVLNNLSRPPRRVSQGHAKDCQMLNCPSLLSLLYCVGLLPDMSLDRHYHDIGRSVKELRSTRILYARRCFALSKCPLWVTVYDSSCLGCTNDMSLPLMLLLHTHLQCMHMSSTLARSAHSRIQGTHIEATRSS